VFSLGRSSVAVVRVCTVPDSLLHFMQHDAHTCRFSYSAIGCLKNDAQTQGGCIGGASNVGGQIPLYCAAGKRCSKHPHWCRIHGREKMFYMSMAVCCL